MVDELLEWFDLDRPQVDALLAADEFNAVVLSGFQFDGYFHWLEMGFFTEIRTLDLIDHAERVNRVGDY
jgi:hypothetical protein